MARKYSKGAQKKVKKAMEERKKGTLRSGPGGKGGKVKSRKQAIAIGLSEARAEGKKVPKKAEERRKKKEEKLGRHLRRQRTQPLQIEGLVQDLQLRRLSADAAADPGHSRSSAAP